MTGNETATWIQAIGSAGSLLAFSIWVGIAILTRKDEHQRRFTQQAQTVASWVDKGERHGFDETFVICIANGGDSPVYRCSIRLTGLTDTDRPADAWTQLVPPHTTHVMETPSLLDDLSWDDLYAGGVAPELEFTDSSGRHWQRDAEGLLTEFRRPRNSTR